ncbi:GNAT family N-acetyltransferase [Luteimonas sp. RIT-PG2_3]
MVLRAAVVEDLEAVSALCIDAFTRAVAPSLSAQGIATFAQIAAADSFRSRMAGDNEILVMQDDAGLQGVVELKQGRHLAMLFVAPGRQQQGIGRALVAAAVERAREDVLTVSASLSSVPAYLRFGFACSGEVAESSGLVYQPMQKPLLAAS